MQANQWYHVLNKTIYKADFTKQLFLQQIHKFLTLLVNSWTSQKIVLKIILI